VLHLSEHDAEQGQDQFAEIAINHLQLHASFAKMRLWESKATMSY
jgi:hypothetical protein